MSNVTISGIKSNLDAKIVNAYGMNIYVPFGTKYLTIDFNGCLEYWFEKPIANIEFGGWYDCSLHSGYCIAKVSYEGNWTDSFVDLTGKQT